MGCFDSTYVYLTSFLDRCTVGAAGGLFVDRFGVFFGPKMGVEA